MVLHYEVPKFRHEIPAVSFHLSSRLEAVTTRHELFQWYKTAKSGNELRTALWSITNQETWQNFVQEHLMIKWYRPSFCPMFFGEITLVLFENKSLFTILNCFGSLSFGSCSNIPMDMSSDSLDDGCPCSFCPFFSFLSQACNQHSLPFYRLYLQCLASNAVLVYPTSFLFKSIHESLRTCKVHYWPTNRSNKKPLYCLRPG